MSDVAVNELREEVGAPAARMGIAVLSLLGVFLSAYLLLHRLGIVGTLACGASGGCETVQSSAYATFLGMPVPAIGVGGYLLLLATALVGAQPALAGDRRIGLAVLALATTALAFTAYLNYIEAFVLHAWCRYCIGSAALVVLIFLLSLTEVRNVARGAQ
ncbi:MAG: vitamin K epoxide reductase family protein [Gemmatimonadetes bacterium]|nr:vitamin K epoxide reductase family protein [Gemmatimonadota bacterium]